MKNKCLGCFLLFLAFPLILLSISALATDQLTHAKFYKVLFQKADTYNRTINLIKSIDTTGNAMTAAIGEAGSGWLQKNVETNLEATFAYMEGKTKTLNFNLDIAPFKKTLPSNIDIPDVITPQVLTDLGTQMNEATKQMAAATGETSSVEKPQVPDFNQQFNKDLERSRQAYNASRIGRFVIYFLTLLTLFFIGLAAKGDWPGILRWEGVALLIPGLFSEILVVIIMFLLKMVNLAKMFKLTPEVSNLLTPLFSETTKAILSHSQLISLIIAGIGLVIIIVSYVLPKNRTL